MIVRLLFLHKLLEAVGPWITLAILLLGFVLVVLVTTVFLRTAHAIFNALARNQGLHDAQLAAWSWGDSLAAAFAVLVVGYATSIVTGSYLKVEVMWPNDPWTIHHFEQLLTQMVPMLTFPFWLLAIAITLRQLLRTTFAKGLAVATLYATLAVSLGLAIFVVVRLLGPR